MKSAEDPVKYGYADAEGKIIIPHQFDEASNFLDGLATVRKAPPAPNPKSAQLITRNEKW